MKDFLKKNLTPYHIVGLIIGFLFAFIYWYKVGKLEENVFKSNLILVLIWGGLVGYISLDLIKSSINRNKK